MNRCLRILSVASFLSAGAGMLVVLSAAPGQSLPRNSAPRTADQTAAPVADFRDLAAAARLTARTIIGGERAKDYILETTGGGVAIVDYDNDGWADIFLVNGARLPGAAPDEPPTSHLYRNNRDGTFADVTVKAGVAGQGWGQGVCAGDYDNDGQVDLFVTYYGRQVLYRNNGDGTFTDATEASRLPGSNRKWNTGAAFLDFDRDGHLDLFVTAYVAYDDATKYPPGSRPDCFWKGLRVMCGPQGLAGSQSSLFRGKGDGTFSDVSGSAGLLKPRPAFGFTPLVLDYDNDGWPDVYVANDSTASLLFHNEQDGRFAEVGLQAGVALTGDGRAQAGMGVSAADYDHDGLLDLVKTNFDDDTPSLYRNLGRGAFDDVSMRAGLGVNTRYLGWGVGFLDFDLDGWRDLLIVNGHVYPEADRVGGRYSYEQPKLLYRNRRDGRFEDVSARAGANLLDKQSSRGAAVGDLFNTGTEDVVVNNMNGVPTLLHNCAPARGHRVAVQLIGTRSNRSAIGARVTVHVGSQRLIDEVRSGGSFCSQNDLRLLVGLGDVSRIDRLEIAWPGGSTETVEAIDADQLVVVREGSGIIRRQPFSPGAAPACAVP